MSGSDNFSQSSGPHPAVKAYLAMQALDQDNDRWIGLDLLEEPEAKRIPLEQGPAWLFVHRIVTEFKQQQLTLDEFLDKVESLQQKASQQFGIFTSQVKQTVNQASEPTRESALVLQEGLASIVEGCGRLLDYADTQNWADIDDGLSLIEVGFRDLDLAESQAHEDLEQTEG